MRWVGLLRVFLCFSVCLLFSDLLFGAKVSLRKCESLALKNHGALRVVKKELKVSETKKKEALRQFFPALTLEAQRTEGRAEEIVSGTPEFEEQSARVQFAQGVFQGGEVVHNYGQVKFLWLSKQFKVEKVRQDTLYNVREAYWNLLQTQESLNIYKEMFVFLEKEKKKADDLQKSGFITKRDFLMIESEYQQGMLKLQATLAELETYLWKWTAALGLKTPPSFRPNAVEKEKNEFFDHSLTLDRVLALAQKYHPQLKVQLMEERSAWKGVKAAKAKAYPKITVSGNYGQSGAAFESEELEMKEDWQVQAKAAVWFGGNKLSEDGNYQKTSPKLGQSSRTEIQTVASSLGIFDLEGFKGNSEKEEAEYRYYQKKYETKATKLELLNSVRSDFTGFKKAELQLKQAENELVLAKVEYAVARVKSGHQQASIADVTKSGKRWYEAQTGVWEAEAGYLISVSKLALAVGVSDLSLLFLEEKRNPL